MRELLESHERRGTKYEINRFSLEQVLNGLECRGCALDGPEASLRERLLRAMLREKEPGNRGIPWYPWDNALVEDEDAPEQEYSRDFAEEEAEVEQLDRELEEQREVAELACINDQQRNVITLPRENVIVHAPVVSVTTSSPTVTRSVTTVATGSLSTATVVTPLSSIKATPGVTRSIFSTQPPPRLVLGRDFRARMDGREGWAYYSEHYMEGVHGARGRQSMPRIDARIEPSKPKAVSHEQARLRWYTPAQNPDDIRNYDSAGSSSYRGLGADSEEDAGVFEHLQSRQRP